MNRVSIRLQLLLCLTLVASLPVYAMQSSSRERFAPPSTLACDRSELTSYNGEVITYQREQESIIIRIRTEWDTTETVTLEHGITQNVISLFLIDGQPFTDADWPRIEAGPGVLLGKTRVIAWVCLDDKTPPVIDWRPQ